MVVFIAQIVLRVHIGWPISWVDALLTRLVHSLDRVSLPGKITIKITSSVVFSFLTPPYSCATFTILVSWVAIGVDHLLLLVLTILVVLFIWRISIDELVVVIIFKISLRLTHHLVV